MNRKLFTAALTFPLFCSIIFMSCKNDTDKRGNTVTVRLTGEPERLNPLTTEEGNAMQVMNNIFLSLLDFIRPHFAVFFYALLYQIIRIDRH